MAERDYTSHEIPARLVETGTLLLIGPPLDREVFRVDNRTVSGEKIVLEQHVEIGGPPGLLELSPEEVVTRLVGR